MPPALLDYTITVNPDPLIAAPSSWLPDVWQLAEIVLTITNKCR
jgi:hypothetical protein